MPVDSNGGPVRSLLKKLSHHLPLNSVLPLTEVVSDPINHGNHATARRVSAVVVNAADDVRLLWVSVGHEVDVDEVVGHSSTTFATALISETVQGRPELSSRLAPTHPLDPVKQLDPAGSSTSKIALTLKISGSKLDW